MNRIRHKPWCNRNQPWELVHNEFKDVNEGWSIKTEIDGDFKVVTLTLANGKTLITKRKMSSEEKLQSLITKARENEKE